VSIRAGCTSIVRVWILLTLGCATAAVAEEDSGWYGAGFDDVRTYMLGLRFQF